MRRRVIALFLDGYEQSLGADLMNRGDLPEMKRLAESSARWLLDHGPAQRTGLAGEHVATGLSPEAMNRWAAVHFDPSSYRVHQVGATGIPFPARLGQKSVVFDAPYFDLHRAPGVVGLVNWGAHDPGVPMTSNPPSLVDEFVAQFGGYPAKQWIYGFSWPSVERTRVAAHDLARAVDVRAKAALWLLKERLPDWELALIAVSEPHSVIEAMWHGIDQAHPLRAAASAMAAGEGVRDVYKALDRLVGMLSSAFPDDSIVMFSMGGMGSNQSDAASMLLLPELLYRHETGRKAFASDNREKVDRDSEFDLSGRTSWEGWVLERLRRPVPSVWDRLANKFRRASSAVGLAGEVSGPVGALVSDLDWMPASAYQCAWKRMRAFALPSFYDGRIRLNLAGRERHGCVRREDYSSAVAECESLVRECIDPATGHSPVQFVERPSCEDPGMLGPTESDLVIVWKGAPLCLEHPRLGRVGPVPYRRTGGHTGPHGMAYVRDDRAVPGEFGVRSSFDVVPTIVELMDAGGSVELSGRSLLRENLD